MPIKTLLLITLFSIAQPIFADQATSTISTTGDNPQTLGHIEFKDSPYGLLITPNLNQLPPGLLGFHLHQHPDCGDHGMHAGSHFDPDQSNSHQGPYGQGHLGDLPALYVNSLGEAKLTVLAPRLKVKDLQGLTVMIH